MRYYKTDSRKLTFGEYWNLTSGFGVLYAWWCKIFGIQIPLTKGIPEPQPLRDQIVQPTNVPSEIVQRFSSATARLQGLGFDQFWFHALKGSLIGGTAYGVLGKHVTGDAIVRVIYVKYKRRERFVVVFVTPLTDGHILITTNKKADFEPAPRWQLHQEKLRRFKHSTAPQSINNFEQLAAFEDEAARYGFDQKIARGLWVQMTEAEVEQLRAQRAAAPVSS